MERIEREDLKRKVESLEKEIATGTLERFQEYQRLALQREIADKQLRAAREYSNAVMTWGTWGPWPWF